jgi:HEAT repeat protein
VNRSAVATVLVLVNVGAVLAQEEPSLDGKPLSQWLTQMRSENRGLQVRAARVLAGAPTNLHARLVPLVQPLLKSERENDRFAAAQALGEYGPAALAAIPDLLPLLEGTQYERNRAAAAKALGQILHDAPASDTVEKVVKALIADFDDKYEDVRREAVTSCGRIGPAAKGCLPAIDARLADVLPVCNAAAWTCGRMGPPARSKVDRLVALLSETHVDHNQERTGAVPEALGYLGPVNSNVVPNLVDKLERYHAGTAFYVQEPGALMRLYALEILRAFVRMGPGAKQAIPYLRRMVDSPRRWHDPEQTLLAVRALGAMGRDASETAPSLQALAKETARPGNVSEDDWKGVREAVAQALAAVEGRAEGGK